MLARLRGEFEVSYFEGIEAANRDTFVAAIRGAHGLLGASVRLSADMLEIAIGCASCWTRSRATAAPAPPAAA
ncbi:MULTISPECIES: hypothetical protein [unclassified Janthinobacterium]|uniref:hypothetical protein n=1 Tax=unclassified Janthinobacterium TaxID=2610881 RepID=UPI0003744BFA|nr:MULTISPECIES: hypothetical protein [unclassified Janthinobacterium]